MNNQDIRQGDNVRIIKRYANFYGKVGTVASVIGQFIRVVFDHDQDYGYMLDEVELV